MSLLIFSVSTVCPQPPSYRRNLKAVFPDLREEKKISKLDFKSATTKEDLLLTWQV
jgi:hypothetical protein